MQSLFPLAEKIAARLIERKETIAVAESSTGGLIAAALLSVPGASAYFIGGAVVYTKTARTALRLRFVDDLDYDGIAARLGCSTVAARQRVSTAVRTLRESYA